MNFDFKPGTLFHSVKMLSFGALLSEISSLDTYKDGYFAFSNKEINLDDLRRHGDLLTGGKVPENDLGVEGYLLEIDLWTNKNGAYEEIYVEKLKDTYFYEKWLLKEGRDEGGNPCYFRKAKIKLLKKSVFQGKKLSALEVIVPEYRISIFLTVTEE
ncbi:MAG: hypothetical protein N2513_09640 [Deltaproteobacteria bacterium]|nr:hypothetical protein [Deltaproteobacteria bacterium]